MGSMGSAWSDDEATKMTVTVRKTQLVSAFLPLQEHCLPQSNLDLLLPPLDVGVFFCYATPSTACDVTTKWSFGSMVMALKLSLAQVLMTYYAFDGEIVVNSAGEPKLLCNNSGVEFVEASASIHLCDLDLYNPDKSVKGKLVPSQKRGVLAVQVTEFKCGGIVVACTFDHRVADAYSANMFLASWAEMSRSSSISIIPSFCRSFLNPRHWSSASTDHLNSAFDDLYVTLPKLPKPPPKIPGTADDTNHLISRIYHLPAEELVQLQQLASTDGCIRTKLESFCSFLWKMLVKSEPFETSTRTSKIGIVVDGRTTLHEADMSTYFGNVLSIPFGEEAMFELAEKPLSWIADRIHDFLSAAKTDDHFLGLIDWVEARRPKQNVAKIYCKRKEDGPAFVVSSGQRFQATDINFGWGKPVFGSYHFPWGGNAGYVMPMPSPQGNGDWIVYMHLTRRQLHFIEEEAADVLKPLKFNYLRQHVI